MRKLRLDLESVVVESFSVDADGTESDGTVAAHEYSEVGSCRGATCGQSCEGVNTNCVCEPDTQPVTWYCASGDYSCQQPTGCEIPPTLQRTDCPHLSCAWTCPDCTY